MHGAFHVSDDGAARVIHEFYAHLRALSLRTGLAQHLGDPGKLDGLRTARVHDGGAAAVGRRASVHFLTDLSPTALFFPLDSRPT